MYHCVKRFIDFVFSLLGIILLSPLFILLSILIWTNMGYPIIFKQKRVGRNRKEFNLYKFRTMTSEKNYDGLLLPDNKRLTLLGKFLRSTSLDELPELLNILKGEMSIIGPRPLLPENMPYFFSYEMVRFDVFPGLIPPEILYGNVFPTWDEQLGYEASYAKNYSFLLDIKIFFSVFSGLLLRDRNNYGSYERKPLSEDRANSMREL